MACTTHHVPRGRLAVIYGRATGQIRSVTVRSRRKEVLAVILQDDEALATYPDPGRLVRATTREAIGAALDTLQMQLASERAS